MEEINQENIEVIVKDRNVNYIFEAPFELEPVNEFISFLNHCDTTVNLFLETPGGFTSYINILKVAIEEYEDIILYPIQECSSAGFLFLLETTVPIKFIDESIRATVHFPRIESKTDINKKTIYDKKDFDKRNRNNKHIKLLKNLDIDSKRKKSLLKGDDIVLYYEDLVKIFKDRIIYE